MIIDKYPHLKKVLILRAKLASVEDWFNINNQVFIQPSKFEINQMLDKKYELQRQLKELN